MSETDRQKILKDAIVDEQAQKIVDGVPFGNGNKAKIAKILSEIVCYHKQILHERQTQPTNDVEMLKTLLNRISFYMQDLEALHKGFAPLSVATIDNLSADDIECLKSLLVGLIDVMCDTATDFNNKRIEVRLKTIIESGETNLSQQEIDETVKVYEFYVMLLEMTDRSVKVSELLKWGSFNNNNKKHKNKNNKMKERHPIHQKIMEFLNSAALKRK